MIITTALELMKSRYNAYTRADIDYINDTTCGGLTQEDRDYLEQWARQSFWQKLEIIQYSQMIVEFKAYYIYQEKQFVHHEKSYFELTNKAWCYKKGEIYDAKISIGRNESCIC